MLSPVNLKILLGELVRGTISHGNLTKIVHLCRSIAESYLSHYRSALVHICRLNGLTLVDLAMDCIAEVFARDGNERFYQVEKFVASLYTSLEDTAEDRLFLAFKSFVLRVTTTQLAKIYSLADPDGARIHRNIKDGIKKSRHLTLSDDFRGCVLELSHHDNLDHLPPYPLDQLERELLAVTNRSSDTPHLLDELARILIEQEEYRRSVRLMDVVQLFRRFYAQFRDFEAFQQEVVEPEVLSELDAEIIQRQVQHTVQQRIISTYLLPGKVQKKEAVALSEIMCRIIADWCQGNGTPHSLYQYVKQYLPVTELEYEATWRNKVEYLTRIAREKLLACVTKNI